MTVFEVGDTSSSPSGTSGRCGTQWCRSLCPGTSRFFDDNVFVLRKGDPIGERIAKDKGILLMICDVCRTK